MCLIIYLLALLCSSLIFCQDLRDRWVSLWALLALGGIGILRFLLCKNVAISLYDWGANLLFISLILGIVRLYFWLKGKQSGFTDIVLGKGDILILYMFCFWFSFTHFIYFYIIGTFFSLATYLVYLVWKGENGKNVPLAGLLMIPFCLYLIEHIGYLFSH